MSRQARVLVAEDNYINQKVALRQLRKLGYTCDAAGNGLEALAALESGLYDIVLMDCQMPLMDGYEATVELRRREQESGRRVTVIAMTAHALEAERERCLAAGMDDYLCKPVKSEELRQMLVRWESRAPSEEAASRVMLTDEPDAEPPVNLEQLLDVSGSDELVLRELVELFLAQTTEGLARLRCAVEAGDAATVYTVAHSCAGGSATCGMTAVVAPLRALEARGYEGRLEGAGLSLARAERQFARVKGFLQENMSELALEVS